MKQKILFYTLNLSSGGAERVISNLANELVKTNDVGIATLTNCDIAYEIDKNVELKIPDSAFNDTGIKCRIKNLRKLIKHTLDYNPDVIIAFCPTMCFILCFLKMFNRKIKAKKVIISERNNPSSEYKSFFTKKIANILYSKADKIVFQTPDACKFFNDKVRKKSCIIVNPINDKFIKNSNIKCKKENSIVNVGRLTSQKNQKMLIEAFSKVVKKNNSYILKIYGKGELEQELKDFTKELKIQNNVKFMGVSNELEYELPKNKIFVLSSDYEGMPNALMEAMSLGLACISTDCPCGGSKMLIENNNNGILIPVGDTQKLADELLNLISDNDRIASLGDQAKKIVDKYNSKRIYGEWKKIIDK